MMVVLLFNMRLRPGGNGENRLLRKWAKMTAGPVDFCPLDWYTKGIA